MKTKIIPFDLETAKKIQAGEIEGKIIMKSGYEVRIICFDRENINGFPIVALAREIENYEGVYFYDKYGAYEFKDMAKRDLVLEVADNEPKFKDGDKVRIRPDSLHGSFVREYDGCIGKIVKIHNGFFVVIVEGAFQAQFRADELELVEETAKHEFKPFDKVLVRNNDEEIWQPRLYEMYSGGTEKHYCQDGVGYLQCIPYEGNEHLVGTTNKPKED